MLLPILPALADDADLDAPIAVSAAWLLLYHSAHILDNIEDREISKLAQEIGEAQAINVATGLIIAALKSISRLRQFSIGDLVISQLEADFHDCVLQMSSAQHEDLSFRRPDIEKCWQIAKSKTGSFFGLPCKSGAQLVTDDETAIERWHHLGYSLGMMVQVADDISGLWMGDGIGPDIKAGGKWTLPIAYSMSVMSEREATELESALVRAPTSDEAASAAMALIESSGAKLYMRSKLHYYRREAYALLLELVPEDVAMDLFAPWIGVEE